MEVKVLIHFSNLQVKNKLFFTQYIDEQLITKKQNTLLTTEKHDGTCLKYQEGHYLFNSLYLSDTLCSQQKEGHYLIRIDR